MPSNFGQVVNLSPLFVYLNPIFSCVPLSTWTLSQKNFAKALTIALLNPIGDQYGIKNSYYKYIKKELQRHGMALKLLWNININSLLCSWRFFCFCSGLAEQIYFFQQQHRWNQGNCFAKYLHETAFYFLDLDNIIATIPLITAKTQIFNINVFRKSIYFII